MEQVRVEKQEMALFTSLLLHPGREKKKSHYGNMSKGFSPAIFITTSVGIQNPVMSFIVVGIIKFLLGY